MNWLINTVNCILDSHQSHEIIRKVNNKSPLCTVLSQKILPEHSTSLYICGRHTRALVHDSTGNRSSWSNTCRTTITWTTLDDSAVVTSNVCTSCTVRLMMNASHPKWSATHPDSSMKKVDVLNANRSQYSSRKHTGYESKKEPSEGNEKKQSKYSTDGN